MHYTNALHAVQTDTATEYFLLVEAEPVYEAFLNLQEKTIIICGIHHSNSNIPPPLCPPMRVGLPVLITLEPPPITLG